MGPFLRKYGVETTVDFQLFEIDGVDLRISAVHASGDSKIMKDEGAEANTSNGFTDEGQGYSLVLTATEMEAARIVVYLVDQSSTKVWLDTAFVIETYGNASAMHAFDLDTAMQEVDVIQVDSTAQRATDLAEIARYLIANSATLTDIIADDSILAKLLATDGNISAFDEASDALQSIRDAITEANPQNHTATASNDTTGTIASGTYANTATDNGTRWQIAPVTPAVNGFGLNVDLVFGIGTGRVPSAVTINGYWNAAPPAGSRAAEVWAYNYLSAAWEQVSDSGTNFDDAAADADYQYALSIDHVQVADGEVKIRFTATSTDTDDDLYLDQVLLSSVAQEAAGLTASAISETVWNHPTSGHDEDTMGYVLGHVRLLGGKILSATSASQFIMDAGVNSNDAYNGMLIVTEDKTDDHYEVRRIVDYIGATNEVFVDRAFGYTPVADDDYYILGVGYADVNTTHIEATDATDAINTQADTALSDYDAPTKSEMDTAHGLLATEAKQDIIDTNVDAILVDTGTTLDGIVDAILVDTGTTLPAAIAGVSAPTAATVADAVWDELLSGHTDAGSAGKALGVATAAPGSTEFTYTLTDSVTSAAIANALVWVTTTNDPDDAIIAQAYTDTNGEAVFYLDAGTYYLWRQKSGYTFTNPDTETIA